MDTSLNRLKADMEKWSKDVITFILSLPDDIGATANIKSVYDRKMSGLVDAFYILVQSWLDDYYLVYEKMPNPIFIINELFPLVYLHQDKILKIIANNETKYNQLTEDVKDGLNFILKLEENDIVAMIEELQNEE